MCNIYQRGKRGFLKNMETDTHSPSLNPNLCFVPRKLQVMLNHTRSPNIRESNNRILAKAKKICK